MKKIYVLQLLTMIAAIIVPSGLWACNTWDTLSSSKPTSCSAKINWTFAQCDIGTYYVEYSLDGGSTFSVIAAVPSTTNTSSDESYSYTDTYACPHDGTHIHVYYRITFVTNSGSVNHSPIKAETYDSACSCTNNNVSRCAGLPSNLSITGADAICNPSSQSYSLSNGSLAIWSITSGSSYLSISGAYPYGTSVSVHNSSSDGVTGTLQASVLGCKTVTKVIMAGVPAAADISLSVPNQFCTNAFGNWAYTNPNTFSLPVSFEWGYVDLYGSSGPVVVNPVGSVQQDFFFDHSATYELYARMRNTCGYFLGNVATYIVVPSDQCTGGGGFSSKKQNKSGGLQANPENGNSIKFSVFPNPVSDILHISLPGYSRTGVVVRVVDLLGRELKRAIPLSGNLAINVSDLKAGVYMVEIIKGGKESLIQKFVKR